MKNLQYGLQEKLTVFLTFFSFIFCLGRIVSIFTKASSGKLTEELEVLLTVTKFYRYFNFTIFVVSALDVISYEFLLTAT